MRREYTLAELAAAVGMTERNVRAYRSRGLIRPPRLRGRVGYYSTDHVTQLRLVQALTGRGLSLTVVGQLLHHGIARTELARLVRDVLPGGRPISVSRTVVGELERTRPELLPALAEHGVLRRTAHGYEADPALLALANQLVAVGADLVTVTNLSLAAARAAATVDEQVGDGLPIGSAAEPSPDDVPVDPTAAVVELATTAFRLSLGARLTARGG